jgi:hypothetical protein
MSALKVTERDLAAQAVRLLRPQLLENPLPEATQPSWRLPRVLKENR